MIHTALCCWILGKDLTSDQQVGSNNKRFVDIANCSVSNEILINDRVAVGSYRICKKVFRKSQIIPCSYKSHAFYKNLNKCNRERNLDLDQVADFWRSVEILQFPNRQIDAR